MGYLEVKCGGKEGLRYGSEAVKSFEHWLKRVPGFREALFSRHQKKEDMSSARIGEYVRLAIESVEKKTGDESYYAVDQAKDSSFMVWSRVQ